MARQIRFVGGWLASLFGLASITAQAAQSPLLEVAKVAVGRAHSCVLTSQGGVRCWGGNGVGQLGLGEVSELNIRATPVPVPGLEGIRDLASGDGHNCVITYDQSVKCWGLNGAGAVGSGEEAYSLPSPRAVIGLDGPVLAVAGGGEHSCALLQGGRVMCWGNNERGQLGDGSSHSRAQAAAVSGLPGAVEQLSLGGVHSCALLSGGAVVCWGGNDQGQLGDGSQQDRLQPTAVQGLPGPMRSLAAGGIASCAVSQAGALYCWGPQYPLLAFDGGSLSARAYPGFEAGYQKVSAGSAHFCALRGDRTIKCLGDDAYGQLGTGPIDGSLEAEFVVGLDPGVSDLASGGWHSCAINGRSGLQCWGLNTEGQLGVDRLSLRLVPVPVLGLADDIASVSAGGFASCALTEGGGVKCWGANGAGEVGDGSTRSRLAAVDVVGLASGVRAIDTGDGSACAITANRGVKCWGAGFDGRLGHGSFLQSEVPVDVVGLPGDVRSLAVGRQHACAVADGGAYCWGSHEFGQLGDGTALGAGAGRATAAVVEGLANGVESISAGYYHSCAVLDDGAMRCWGHNGFGQLGVGTREHSPHPQAVLGLQGPVRSATAGIANSCALLRGGSGQRAQCWGAGFFGNLLGDGEAEDRLQPGPLLPAGGEIEEISFGGFQACLRLRSGAARCWGQGGNVGDNSLHARQQPTEVAGLGRGVEAISAGFGGHSCAVRDGRALCWGYNLFGQLGDGTTYGEPTAQTVVVNQLRRRVSAFAQTLNAEVGGLRLDASGRYTLLHSDAASLVPGDDNGRRDVFLLDRELRQIERVSLAHDGSQISADAGEASMSADARLIAFVTEAAAVSSVLNETKQMRLQRLKGGGSAVFLRNMLTGSTQQVGPALPQGAAPQLSASGNAIVFSAPVADAGEGEVGQANVYRVPITPIGNEVALGVPSCVSCKPSSAGGLPATGNADGASGEAVLSADGSKVAYSTQAKNAVAGMAPVCPEASSAVILRDLLTGATVQIAPPPGTAPAACGSAGSSAPSIDYSGQVLALQSDQPLSPSDSHAGSDIYVFDLAGGQTLQLSVGQDGSSGNADSDSPQLSGDGRQVAFLSSASNLDTSFADNNDSPDVHTVSVGGGVTRLSQSTTGAEAETASSSPTLNYDGSQVAFVSSAAALTGLAGTTAVLARENPQAPTRKSATWWVPSEAGWGFTVFDQGDLLTPTWFTYDADGEPTWFLVAGAFPQDDGSFRGNLLRFRASSFNAEQAPNEANAQIDEVGEAVLRYQGEQQLQFDYSVDGIAQGKTLRRFPFGARNFSCSASASRSRAEASNYTDLWSGAEAGSVWGLTLFHVDALLVAIWYTYDDDGEAVFFVITAVPQENGVYDGTVFRQPDGTAFSAIDGMPPSGEGVEIGSARFRFLDGERAEFSHTIDGITRTRSIQRLLVGSTAQVCQSVDAIE